ARLSLAGRAATGRATGSLARTAGLAAGRLTRQSFSSTNGRCGATAGATGAGAAEAAIGAATDAGGATG
ncbi:hypothetical protein ACSTIS_23470, partial [Vibrio parahaemolyticus]